MFNLEILEKLGNHHKNIMNMIKTDIDKWKTDKDIYEQITKYIIENNLNKAFPIGISINNIVAHDSYHETNIKKLSKGDYIKIDVGLEESGNIIDSARTFIYNESESKPILDSKEIVEQIEKYIQKELDSHGLILIQKISVLTNVLIVSKGYNSVGLLGGHTIEFGKVHGRHLILNQPLNLLPEGASSLIDSKASISNNEMFAIEIYIPEYKCTGELIQNITIPITHYEINDNKELLEQIKLLNKEIEVYNKIKEETKGLVYEYHIHKKYDNKLIKNLIEKKIIIKHYALDYKSVSKVKFVQYEDCFIIKDKKLINLSK